MEVLREHFTSLLSFYTRGNSSESQRHSHIDYSGPDSEVLAHGMSPNCSWQSTIRAFLLGKCYSKHQHPLSQALGAAAQPGVRTGSWSHILGICSLKGIEACLLLYPCWHGICVNSHFWSCPSLLYSSHITSYSKASIVC